MKYVIKTTAGYLKRIDNNIVVESSRGETAKVYRTEKGALKALDVYAKEHPIIFRDAKVLRQITES